MNAVSNTLDLAPALVVLPGGRAAACDASGPRLLRPEEARGLALSAPVVVAHASLTAKRLDLPQPGRSPLIFDALEIEKGPVATVHVPIRMRFGLHGNFAPSEALGLKEPVAA